MLRLDARQEVSARAMACWAASTAVVNASGDNIDTIDSRGSPRGATLLADEAIRTARIVARAKLN